MWRDITFTSSFSYKWVHEMKVCQWKQKTSVLQWRLFYWSGCVNIFNNRNTSLIKMLYRVPQKYGTLYATIKLRVAGQPNLGVLSTNILPFFNHDKGPRALWKAPNRSDSHFSFENIYLVAYHWTRQIKTSILTIDTSNRFLRQAVSELPHF